MSSTPCLRSPDLLILSGPSFSAALVAFSNWQTEAKVAAAANVVDLDCLTGRSRGPPAGLGLLLTAAPRSEKERCYEDEAQVRALTKWGAGGGRGLVATDGPSKPQDIGQLVDPLPPHG